ncbi:MAG: hypothetical protein R3F58_08340 [Steroidobacteraceae bacterium]
MQFLCFLAALQLFLGVACGSELDMPSLIRADSQREIEQLSVSIPKDCAHCLFMYVFDRFVRLPNRYVVRGKKTNGCTSLISPVRDWSGDLSRPAPPFEKRPGRVFFCEDGQLDVPANGLIDVSQAVQVLQRDRFEVLVWAPVTEPKGFPPLYAALIRTQEQGLYIEDPNPLLWEHVLGQLIRRQR